MLHMAMERHLIGYNSREIADRKCHQRFCRALFAVYLESDKMTNILCTTIKSFSAMTKNVQIVATE